ncbi:MAG: DUF547 domain-containing protein [Fluviicola sp.]
MKKGKITAISFLILSIAVLISCASEKEVTKAGELITSEKPNKDGVYETEADTTNVHDHVIFNKLLSQHVSEEGKVNYKGFIKDSLEFNKYLNLLAANHPTDSWTDDQIKAYWINAYNAYTVQLIIRNYPVNSIKDLGGSIYKVNTTWDIKFIKIGEETYDLNNIEHGILRSDFEEPRIHFAVNCASVSCPRLRNEAYVASRLNDQLDDQARKFINYDPKNDITTEKAHVSKIFTWFSGDFKKNGSVKDFINKYADVQIPENVDLTYQEYIWTLNE